MSKENDIEKLKSDLETLVKDCKQIFGSFKDTLKVEIDNKKEEIEGHLHKIKTKISEESSKSGLFQYLTVAFVVGIVFGALMNKKDKK